MRLRVQHVTIYRYSEPVRESTNEVRLLPRSLPRQRLLREELRVEPHVPIFHSEDYWGNRVAHFNLLRPHRILRITSLVEVETDPPVDLSGAAPWPWSEPVAEHDLRDYLLPTPLTAPPGEWGPLGPEAAALRTSVSTLPEFLDGLSWLLKERLRYEPGSTTVDTTVPEFLRSGAGVCQDFAHLFVSLCRGQGIPARYCGGYHYLGPGAERHENHAWAEAYIPGCGWAGWDPANGIRVGEAHVQITAGRDFNDVSPVRGSYRGPAGAELEVRLTMEELP